MTRPTRPAPPGGFCIAAYLIAFPYEGKVARRSRDG